ncbi:MAG: GNAT family N-acetyltransferase [Cucumibacter sp.]
MSGATIRALQAGEADILRNVAAGVFDEAVDPALASAYLAEPRFHLLVALSGDLVIGMATGLVYSHPDKGPQFFVNEVGVGDDYLRQGIARDLMRALFIAAKTAGCTCAWVGTETDNDAANGLYRALGGAENRMNFFEFDLKG